MRQLKRVWDYFLPPFDLSGPRLCCAGQGGVAYYKSAAVTGTKKDPKSIAKQASGPFDCGEVGFHVG